jgi:hypothetical protein
VGGRRPVVVLGVGYGGGFHSQAVALSTS